MIKTMRTAVVSALLFVSFGCGSGAPNGAIPYAMLQGTKVSTWMYQIQDLNDKAVGTLAATAYDMMVIEPGFNLQEDPYDTAKIVTALATKPNGDKRVLLAYIDIGQAEDYRDYWQTNWVAPTKHKHGSPDFLITIDPDGWSGNYPVAYWDARWKSIWLGEEGIIAKLVAYGFDGVYLDWVEAYDDEKVMAYARQKGVDAQKEMLAFIREIKEKAKAKNPNFVIVAQNAPYLLDDDPKTYAAIIDAIATEDTWYYGEGDADWDDKGAGDLHGGERHDEGYSTEERIKQSQKYLQRGIPVLTVDYCVSKKHAERVYRVSREQGFVPIVTRVSLSRLTQTPPPEFSHARAAQTIHKAH